MLLIALILLIAQAPVVVDTATPDAIASPETGFVTCGFGPAPVFTIIDPMLLPEEVSYQFINQIGLVQTQHVRHAVVHPGPIVFRVSVSDEKAKEPLRTQVIDARTKKGLARTFLYPYEAHAYKTPKLLIKSDSYFVVAYYTGTASCVKNSEELLGRIDVE